MKASSTFVTLTIFIVEVAIVAKESDSVKVLYNGKRQARKISRQTSTCPRCTDGSDPDECPTEETDVTEWCTSKTISICEGDAVSRESIIYNTDHNRCEKVVHSECSRYLISFGRMDDCRNLCENRDKKDNNSTVFAVTRHKVLVDFEKFVKDFVNEMTDKYDSTVDWWDIYGRGEKAETYPDLKRYKVKLSVGPVNFGPVQRTSNRTGYVYDHWIHNSEEEQSITGDVDKTVSLQTSCAWSLEQGVKIDIPASASVGTPSEFAGCVTTSVDMPLTELNSKTTTVKEEYSISNTITVDPMTSVRAEWTITEQEVEVPWEVEISFKGHIAMWFNEAIQEENLWFSPVYFLGKEPFQPSGIFLKFTVKGSFTGVKGIESVLKTYEFPLQSTNDTNGAEPDKVTVVEQTAHS